MAKVLFVEYELRTEKLGLMYVSAALKRAGHETRLLWTEREDPDAVINEFRPDFLGLSLTTGSHGQLLDLAARLKADHGVKVVAGGPHATFFADEIGPDQADFVVAGQGERAMVDIAEGRALERVLRYDLADLDSLPFPDRELFYRYPEFRDNPMKNVITCRDCPYSCSYCYNHAWKARYKNQKRFLQKRAVQSVLDEINDIRSRYPLRQVIFIDDNFLVKRSWIEEFCERYPQEVGLPFLCCFSLNLLDEDLLVRLKKAGLVMVNFALESATPEVQKRILNRGHVRNEHIESAVELLARHKIKTRMQNMIGLPVPDPLADALRTLDFNRRCRVDDSWVSILQPYPNTAMADYCVRHGYIEAGQIECAPSFFESSCLKIADANRIARLQKWWYFAIKYDFDDQTLRFLLDTPLSEGAANALLLLRFEFSKKYLFALPADPALLRHDPQAVRSRHAGKPHFDVFWPLIERYRLCDGLADILMTLSPPARTQAA